jgi:hypothetical protein
VRVRLRGDDEQTDQMAKEDFPDGADTRPSSLLKVRFHEKKGARKVRERQYVELIRFCLPFSLGEPYYVPNAVCRRRGDEITQLALSGAAPCSSCRSPSDPDRGAVG